VTDREWALLFHLVGLVLLFSGLTLAAAARRYAPPFGDRAVAAPEAGDRLTRA
jgi:hypothetical protein